MTTELRTIRLLIWLFRRHRLAMAASVILGILSSFAEGIGVALFIPFVQTAMGSQSGTAPFLVRFLDGLFAGIPPERRLLVICLGILGAVLAKAVLYYVHGIVLSYLDWKMGYDIRSRLTHQLLTANFRDIERRDSADLLNTLSTESWNATDALSVVLDILVTACTLLVYITLMLLISPALTAVSIAAMLAISLIVRLLTRHVKALGQMVTKENTVLATRMLETVEGNKTIRVYGRERYQQGRFDAVSEKLGRLNWRLGCVGGLLGPIYEFGGATLLVFILFASTQNPANLGSALVFIFALYRAQPRMAALDEANVSLRTAAASIDAVTSMLGLTDTPRATTPGADRFEGVSRDISFERVSFKYHADDPFAIQDLFVRFPARKTTALVGPSGAGKSTIIKLILRLYDVEQGVILVDGRPIGALDLSSWREKIAVVSQDAYVFNATIRDNIAYGRLDATDREIVDAAKRANAHEFIAALPHGYLTKVGDRGVRLSTGQVQRLTLARAIVRDPDILVLDEATNSVDSISERIIQEALETFAKTRTVIIIAHRFSTIAEADHIVVLDQGRVQEQGSLDALVAREGLFSRLYAAQRPGARSGSEAVGLAGASEPARSERAASRSPFERPLISVIIPCYNQASYLRRAIDSVLSQTYERHEIVVVDDGSDDHIDEVAAAYPGVTFLEQTHQGLPAARNAGIDASSGELLVFLDADDRLLPEALDAGLQCLRMRPDCGFVFGAHRTITEDDDASAPATPPAIQDDVYVELLTRNCVAMHGSALFRRDAVLAVGKYDGTLLAAEDYDLCLRIARRFPITSHTTPVAEYWKHEGNMSRDFGLMLRESLRALRKQARMVVSLEERAALRWGIRHTQRYYGEPQWGAVKARLKRKDVAGALRAAFTLLRFAPATFVVEATAQVYRTARALMRWATSHVEGLVERRSLDVKSDLTGGSDGSSNGEVGRRRSIAKAPAPPIILLYHRVADLESDPWGLAVSPRNFRDHMRVLANERRCIPVSELVQELAAGRYPSGTACVTFDDGYSDNLLNARPILQEFSVPATFFLTSGYLRGDSDFWWDALENPFFRKTRIPPTLEIEIERALMTFDFVGDTEYRDAAFAAHREWRAWERPLSKRHVAYHRLWKALHRLPSPSRDRVIDTIQGWATPRALAEGGKEDGGDAGGRPLSSEGVRQLAAGSGVEIGGHTVTHPCLPLLDRDAQEWEIVENKRRLEELLERPLRYFSYPHGELSDDTVSLLKQAGYEAAWTNKSFCLEPSTDLFKLPRVCVEDWNRRDFARKVKEHFVDC
jgi:subfamily B ATP-binding cassette protein MsbA